MANRYVERMRLVLKSYYELTKLRDKEIKENEDLYLPDSAERVNREIRERKIKDYADARNEIVQTYESVRSLLAKASFPNPDDITQDANLFSNPYIKLTDAEIQTLAVKYRDAGNHTMLRILSNWCEDHGRNSIETYSAEEQLSAYGKLAESALYTVNGIYSGKRDHFIDLEIESYADPTLCKRELDTIGDGEGLKQNESKEVPDSALHRFDEVNLKNDVQ